MRVPIPLPDRDFDVTEVAVPWRVLRDAGHQAVFATEQAGPSPRRTPDCSPGCYSGTWAALDVTAFDGLLLPGGHTSGMRQYLGSSALREQVARFWAAGPSSPDASSTSCSPRPSPRDGEPPAQDVSVDITVEP